MVEYKAKTTLENSRVTVVKIDPKNTSLRCNACGHTAPGNRQSQAVFQCVKCGHLAHAGTNAARNILQAGELKNLEMRYAVAQIANGRASHGLNPVPR
jgi:putative transposase